MTFFFLEKKIFWNDVFFFLEKKIFLLRIDFPPCGPSHNKKSDALIFLPPSFFRQTANGLTYPGLNDATSEHVPRAGFAS